MNGGIPPHNADEAAGSGAYERRLDNLLKPIERPLLDALAARTPAWVTPNHMTLVGVAGAALCGVSAALTNWHSGFLLLVCLGLVINWYGDSLDGTIARKRNIERRSFGFFVDHVTDLFSQVTVLVGIGLSPYVRMDAALLALAGYLIVSNYTYIRLHVTNELNIAPMRVGPTEARVLVILFAILAFVTPIPSIGEIAGGPFTIIDGMCALAFVAAAAHVATSFFSEGRAIAEKDPARRAED